MSAQATIAPKVVGLIAGGRQFPVLVAQGVKAAGHRLVVAGFAGHTNAEVYPLADIHRELKLGQLAKLLDFLKENKVELVVMAGTINKPGVMDIRHFDARAVKLLFSLGGKGDDAILRAVTRLLESEGMALLPPQAFAQGLLTPPGVLTRRAPDEREAGGPAPRRLPGPAARRPGHRPVRGAARGHRGRGGGP